MAVGEERQGRRATAAVDKFPTGLRVLAVDDDPVCLKLLEALLHRCNYHVTTASHAETALQMLREGKDQFDLVISDVHMSDMDSFKLLELIGLEMNLPVIMLSANGEIETMMKGITHGACDYLVKPVHAKELKNIWQHVVRRNPDIRHRNSGGNDDADQKVQLGIAEGEQRGAKRTRKYARKKRNDGDDSDENKENTNLPAQKKPRVVWTSALHRKFVEIVNRIGIDKAVPKKITDMMNIDYLTRESVASHLQKYRIYLKRLNAYTSKKAFVDASKRWNSCMEMNDLESFKYYNEHGRWRPSLAVDSSNLENHLAGMDSPSALGAHGLLPTQTIQHRNAQNNLGMGTIVHGGSMLTDVVPEPLPSDARKCLPSSPSTNSFACISNHTMFDASNGFPSCHSGNSYASILRGKLLEASKGITSCHSGNSFENVSNGGVPANQSPEQSPKLGDQPSVQMNSSSTYPFSTVVGDASQFVDLGSCSNTWQTAVPSEFSDLVHKDGNSLGPLKANIPKINKLASLAASSGQMSIFANKLQNQMAAIIGNTTSMAGFNEQMVLFNTGSNSSSIEMLNGNFALGSASSINSALPNLQIGSSVAPTQMLNGGGAGGILPVQDGTIDQQVVVDQLNYSNGFFTTTDEPNGSENLDDIVGSMLNQDFIEDDAFFHGDW